MFRNRPRNVPKPGSGEESVWDYPRPPGRGASFCEWKGRASYWDVRVGERVAENAAWGYPEPTAAYRALADYLAFYPGRVDACRSVSTFFRPA